MYSDAEEHARRANSLLNAINELVSKAELTKIVDILQDCDCLSELAQASDKDGQGIFFKLTYLPDEVVAIEWMKKFKSMGGAIKRKDNNKQSVLYYTARYEKELMVKYMISLDFPLNENDYIMQTPLFYSARFNKKVNIARMLIEAGCEINHKDSNGQTPLFYAAAEGNLEMCRLLAQNGANILATDKNKQRALNYAKRNDHRHVVEFLSNSRNDLRKVRQLKEERRVQQSSQNTVDRRKKKESSKNQYSLVYINQDGETKVLSRQELLEFKNASEDNDRLLKIMISPEQQIEALPNPPDRKFEKTVSKILNHFMRHENGAVFSEPVNYQTLGIFDYPSIVKYPMDFGTIKKKIMLNGYQNELQFQGDMNLVFDNCILYNGTTRDIGKIALQMKTEFNAMFIKEFS